ncbi:MAG: hydantoinase B/oxoprolinase family protein [Alphaproteobacteria bacterium]|nr:hydantoinase B/oxoprolinase family protein [Alphaproteobacteria bacterium]
MSELNPVQLEIIRNALVAAAEEMSVTVWRTSRSSVVRDILDYSTAVFDDEGRSVAQAARMPVHLNSMASCLTDLLAKFIPLADWHEGDVVITNDPYCGGQHLPDWLTFQPVFVDGRRIAIAGILVHHLDVGGGSPGSYHAGATEIFHEGIRIPPIKIVEAGRKNEAAIRLILQNSREPANVGGDFLSQLAALDVGARNLRRIARRYGPDCLALACRRIQAQSEAAMRAAIWVVPDGRYSFEDFIDDDGIDRRPLRIHARVTVAGEELTIDLSGSSPQARGPVNCTYNMTDSAAFCGVMMSLGTEIAANAGCYRPIRLIAPEGLVVNARAPAPVANRMACGHRIVNAVMGAFAQALPERIPAAYYGVSYSYALNAINADHSRQVYFDLECGGWGGHPEEDGANAFSCGFHNIANTPIELAEASLPITFLRYGLKPDSGGPGKHRGGLGLAREFRLDAPAGVFAASFDRFTHRPYGLAGGAGGAAGRLMLRRAGEGQEQALPSKVSDVAMRRGDVIRLETAGGGGHGAPAARDQEAIRRDLAEGYLSAEAARRDYGYDGT